MSTIAETLQEIAMKNQTATAIAGDDPVTFSSLWAQTDAFAGGLQDRDITAGDAVAIRLSNPRAFLIAVYGTLRNGSIPVTIPTDYSTADITTVLRETGGNAYVTDATPFLGILNRVDTARVAITVDLDARMGIDLPSFLDNDGMNSGDSRTGIDIVRQSDESLGLIAYVGYDGTEPLGAAYTHSAMVAAADTGKSILDGATVPRHLGSLPLSNPIELMYGANAAILDGGQYHPHADWDPETARSLLYTDDVDRTFLTSSQYEAFRALEAEADHAVAVIEPMTAPLEAVAGDAPRYRGSPETGITHVTRPENDEPESLGELLPDIETRTLERDSDAELAISSPATMDEYVSRPELTEKAITTTEGTQWIRTGGLASDDSGM